MSAPDPVPVPIDAGWRWDKFKGSQLGLKWNRRDVHDIPAILDLVPGRTAAVQAGGNLGIFPKALARAFQTVYTFEPAPDLFLHIAHNAPEPNIVKLQAALGDGARLVEMSRVRRDAKPAWTTHEGISHVAGPGTLPMMRLDDLRLPVVDLVYLDLEGYELFALWGAVETIARCRPVLAIEINKGITYEGYTREDVNQWICDRGYRFVLSLHSDKVFVPVEVAA